MGFADALKSFFSRYTDFKGRSSRSEYWWPQLAFFLVGIIIGVLTAVVGETVGNILLGIFYLVILIPGIAISIRRLHDLDKSGWWLLIALIPLIGALVLFFFFVQRGTVGGNRFGEDPLGNLSQTFS